MTVLHSYTYGAADGPPLLAVHGVTGHARRYERAATEGWPHRRTLAVDLRGHGFSTWDPAWSIEQHVDDLLNTLDAHELDVVDVVGHSYGGAIAMHLLGRAPARVRRVVLLDPALEMDPLAMRERAEGTIAFTGFETLDDAIQARNDGLGADIHPAVPIEIEQHLVTTEDGRLRFRFSPLAVATGFGEVCRPLPLLREPRPTLVVVAQRAEVVTPRQTARLQQLLGDALAIETLDSGHMVYWERFEEIVALVDGYLAEGHARARQ
jgi:lipase